MAHLQRELKVQIQAKVQLSHGVRLLRLHHGENEQTTQRNETMIIFLLENSILFLCQIVCRQEDTDRGNRNVSTLLKEETFRIFLNPSKINLASPEVTMRLF